VVGGGFVLSAPPSNQDFLYPIESRREGKKAWRVSAYRVDQGGAGPALTLSAEAYCRDGLGKLTEKSAGNAIVGSAADGSPVVTCGVGKTPLGGGFAFSGPSGANNFSGLVYDNLMAGKVGWVHRATNLLPPSTANIFTSFAYCQQKGEKAPKTVTGVGATPATLLGVARRTPPDARARAMRSPAGSSCPPSPALRRSRSRPSLATPARAGTSPPSRPAVGPRPRPRSPPTATAAELPQRALKR
jgi:hypothetical protein